MHDMHVWKHFSRNNDSNKKKLWSKTLQINKFIRMHDSELTLFCKSDYVDLFTHEYSMHGVYMCTKVYNYVSTTV